MKKIFNLFDPDSPVDSQPAESIRLFVIAHQEIYVDGLIRVIQDQMNHKLLACIKPGNQCLERFKKHTVDILMIEQSAVMEQLRLAASSETVFRAFQEHNPDVKIIIFGHNIETEFIHTMLHSGVQGFIDSTMSQSSMNTAISEIYNGGYWIGHKAFKQILSSVTDFDHFVSDHLSEKLSAIRKKLTERETDVLLLVIEGLSNREIAARLFLSEQSVKLHLGHLFRKFEVSSRSQLISNVFLRISPSSDLLHLVRKHWKNPV